jgi:hypothetical protein
MRRAGLVAVMVALAVPSLARAQLAQSNFFIGGTPISVRAIPARITGQLTVDFHGDAASGCASRGLCGYAGTVSWRPPGSGALEIYATRVRHRISYELYFSPGNPAGYPGAFGGVTTAMVQLSSPPLAQPPIVSSCLDAIDTSNALSLPLQRGRVAFTLAGASSSLLGTRCAGPLDGDVVPQLPAPTLPLGAVLRGRTAVALTASREFASHGFAGTVQSSLAIALGRPGRTMRTQPGNAAQGSRGIQVRYRATLSGSLVERIRGDADPGICAALGSCGLAGSITLRPHATHATASIEATAAPHTPYLNLLAAVGLSTRGRARGVVTFGAVNWRGGAVQADLAQGSTTCRDSAPLGAGVITLAVDRGRIAAAYEPGFASLMARTRCPGPLDTSANFLAAGTVPAARLARRTIRLALSTGATFVDDGYGVRTLGHLTLTLTRVGVSTRVSSGAGAFVGTLGSSGGSFFGP